MKYRFKDILSFCLLLVCMLFSGCNNDETEIEYASNNPDYLVGDWIAFQFQGGSLSGQYYGNYTITTAISPDNEDMLIVNNIYDTDVRIKVPIIGDTTIYSNNTAQLEVINEGSYGIESVSIDGYFYHVDNYSYQASTLQSFMYSLAESVYENISFSEDDIEDLMVFYAGLYDSNNSLIDSILVMGYRKTGLEDVDSNN